MTNGTPSGRSAPRPGWLGRLVEALEQRIFRETDLDAIARGWQVRRGRPFTRTYRDPRWDSISVCPTCQGSGSIGSTLCPRCDGNCTIHIGLEPNHASAS